MKRAPLIVLCVVLVAAVHLDNSGTHLLAVLLGMALAQGSVLVVAAAELSNAAWIKPVKRPLLAPAPLLFILPFLVKLAPYPWLQQETRWLSADFFLARNIVALLVVAIIANIFRRVSLAESPAARRWAVVYILVFVVTETLVAVDWVMSFDYPWVSTMFPVLYMIECFYAGLALLGMICFVREQRKAGSAAGILYDGASLLFGFALFWGGLFFAQYLTIWYGNIPEEARYFSQRFALPGGKHIFTAVCILLFGVPFTVLLIHQARKSPATMLALALAILIGLVLHRAYHLLPHVSFNLGLLLVQSLAMFSVVALSVWPALEE
jgi:hypothetical protein